MARPGRSARNRAARSFRQLRRFHRVINSDKVFGTHRCELKNGIVHCVGTAIYPSTLDPGSERREMKAYTTRETGEYNFFMETESFTGRNASGKKRGGRNDQRTG